MHSRLENFWLKDQWYEIQGEKYKIPCYSGEMAYALQASTVTKCKLSKSGCTWLKVVEMLKDWCKL